MSSKVNDLGLLELTNVYMYNGASNKLLYVLDILLPKVYY